MSGAASFESLLQMLQADAGVRTALKVAPRLTALDALIPNDGRRQVRIALLGSSTLDQLADCLAAACYRRGLRPRMYTGGFDQYAQEILDDSSGLYTFGPDVLILAVHPTKLFPVLYEFPPGLSAGDRESAVQDGIATLRSLISRFRSRSSAPVIVHNMAVPRYSALGVSDWRDVCGQRELFYQINSLLACLARDEFAGVYALDLDLVEARCGKSRATDVRLWLAARLPWSEPMLEELTTEHMRFLNPLLGLSRKCLVLDLDGTLWGGVVGENGVDGLQLGVEAPGNAFVMFQREIRRLWRRGVMLAICSKNNEAEALEAFRHPAMVLRQSDFAARRINWEPKPDNLREIAEELNIGLDSLVFFDDSPAERAAVRSALPQVLCPDLPRDPAHLRDTLLALDVFDTLELTAEDFRRNAMYAEQHERKRFAAEHAKGPLEQYLSELDTVVDVVQPSPATLPRLAQLTQKTNQFNLTTRRYSEGELASANADGTLVIGLRVTDRFGDSGVVGLAIAGPRDAGTWEIDALLLSCRVIGRGVESALLSYLSEQVRLRGGERLLGRFVPTERNAPARDCYPRHGFRLRSEIPGGVQSWEFDLTAGALDVPTWIQLRSPAVVEA